MALQQAWEVGNTISVIFNSITLKEIEIAMISEAYRVQLI